MADPVRAPDGWGVRGHDGEIYHDITQRDAVKLAHAIDGQLVRWDGTAWQNIP